MSDYDVGYGKPPKSGQIRKGEVRNPNGRAGKKRSARPPTSERELLEKIDAEVVVVDGTPMTRREMHVRSQYLNALKGKANAIRFIDRLSQRSEGQGGGVIALPCDSPDGWNVEDAIAQYHARLKRERRNDRRRSKRANAKLDPSMPLPLRSEWEILASLDAERVEHAGNVITRRELRLRLYKAFAIKGNRAAQQALARIQDTPKAIGRHRPGVLVVPAPVSLEEWSVMAAKQQAPFRETQHDVRQEFSAGVQFEQRDEGSG